MNDFASPGSAELEAPDLIQPVVAFRNWRIVEGRLRSPYAGVFWNEPVLRAHCHRLGLDRSDASFCEAAHTAPASSCTCGIYAYLEPDPGPSMIDYRAVTGIVTVWGAIEVHPEGMRAQNARVEALAIYPRWSSRQKKAVWATADELGVDLIDLSLIDEAAEHYGARLPRAMVPLRSQTERARLAA